MTGPIHLPTTSAFDYTAVPANAAHVLRERLRAFPSLTAPPTKAVRLATDPAESGIPDETSRQWLLARGVPISAIGSPWAVRASHVVFTPNGRYVPSVIGDAAFIFAVIDHGIVDLVAWSPSTGQIATRMGAGWALGQGQLGAEGSGTTGAPLPLFRNLLGWLRNNRRGLVILDWEFAGYMLARAILRPEDPSHCRELTGRLKVPPPIFVPPQRLTA